MIIENPDALRAWLTAWLGPKCDADPAALSKYVMALVKKDKSEKELKDICIDQLDVFLQRGTKQFVDLLFETLNSKSYLETHSVSEPLNGSSVETATTSVKPPIETGTLNGAPATVPLSSNTTKPSEAPVVSSKVTPVGSVAVTSSVVTSSVTSNSKSDAKRPKSGNESDERETKRSRIGRSKSRSKSPHARSSRSKVETRDGDDRRPRRFPDDDRRRKGFSSRRYDNRYREFRRGNNNMESNDRDRDNRQGGRSKDRKGGRNSDRNMMERSKSRSRSGSPWNNRNRSRSWSSSRSRSRSPSHSRSRSWSRSRDRNRESSRGENRETRTQQSSSTNDHGDKDYRNPPTTGANATAIGPGSQSGNGNTANASGNNASNSTATTEVSNFRSKHPRRCRDYDEKGYCMRGDQCPYDHGMDPVVLEDVSVIPGFPPPNDSVTTGNQSSQMLPPPGLINPVHNQSNTVPTEPFLPEPYNPLEPGMERPARMRSPFWGHPPPPHGPPGTGPPLRPPLGSRGPPHMFHTGPPQRTRELIGVPTIDNPELSGPKSVIHRTVLEPLQPQVEVATDRPNPVINSVAVPRPQGYMRRGIHDNGGFRRRIFDYNRLGPRKMPMNSNVDRCTLELRKVPRHLNTIAELNSHFSKFGSIVNLQVCFSGDPEAALIQFSSHSEANAAYRCTDAVLNNRFIKVFWHNKENASGVLNPPNVEAVQTADSTEGKIDFPSVDSTASIESKVEIPAKSNIKDRLGIAASMTKINNVKKVTNNAEDASSTEKAVLFTPSGNLSRTVYNPLALKKNNLVAANSLPRKSKEEQRKEVLKKKLEVQNKRQQIIQMHVQQQKILVSKFEKCKNEKEKATIKEQLMDLNKTIDTLGAEVRKMASEIMTLTKALAKTTPKSKTDAEKELLDAEMDLYNKQHRGDDTTELRKKVQDLKQQAKALGLLDSSGQLKVGAASGYAARGRATGVRYRGRGGVVMMPRKLTTVDRRPKKLLVEGSTDLDRDTLLMHFSQCSLVERLEMLSNGMALVTFKTRRDAEKALLLGAKLNEQPLKVSWYNELSTAVGSEDSNLEGRLDISDLRVNDENLEQSEDEEEDTLLGDDEEEEDSEARSWRR